MQFEIIIYHFEGQWFLKSQEFRKYLGYIESERNVGLLNKFNKWYVIPSKLILLWGKFGCFRRNVTSGRKKFQIFWKNLHPNIFWNAEETGFFYKNILNKILASKQVYCRYTQNINNFLFASQYVQFANGRELSWLCNSEVKIRISSGKYM